MKARLLEARVSLYAAPDATSTPVAELVQGQEFEVTGSVAQNGQNWATVTLPDGSQGYLAGTTKIFWLREARLTQDVSIAGAPSAQAPLLGQARKGTVLLILDKDDQFWIKVRMPGGLEGFIPRGSSMEDPRRAAAVLGAAQRNMWVGGAWCAGGVAVTAYTYTAASGGGTYVVAWGAIIFGGWQFVRGLIAFLER